MQYCELHDGHVRCQHQTQSFRSNGQNISSSHRRISPILFFIPFYCQNQACELKDTESFYFVVLPLLITVIGINSLKPTDVQSYLHGFLSHILWHPLLMYKRYQTIDQLQCTTLYLMSWFTLVLNTEKNFIITICPNNLKPPHTRPNTTVFMCFNTVTCKPN